MLLAIRRDRTDLRTCHQ